MDKDEFRGHISHDYDSDLMNLHSLVKTMGDIAQQQVKLAIDALINTDGAKANLVIVKEEDVNALEKDIDKFCATTIARRQPTAIDLRLILAVTKINTDLERIGDEASKIAKQTLLLAERNYKINELENIKKIAHRVTLLLDEAIIAYEQLDVKRAYMLVREDLKIESFYETVSQKYVSIMVKESSDAHSDLKMLWCLRAMERIADHATNIAEQIIFLVKGIDVRHVDIRDLKDEVLKES